jgi:hypothetical protein
MSKNAVAVPETSNSLPSLYAAPDDLGSITLPRILMSEGQSKAVQAGLTKPGDAWVGLGSTDPDPNVLARFKDNGPPESFLGYVVGKQVWYGIEDDQGRWTRTSKEAWEASRASGEKNNHWRNHDYLVAMPDIDPIFPARLTLKKTAGIKPSSDINSFLFRAGLTDQLPPLVKFSVGRRTNNNGQTYHFFQVSCVQADENLQAALQMTAFQSVMDRSAPEGVVEGAEPTPAGPGF